MGRQIRCGFRDAPPWYSVSCDRITNSYKAQDLNYLVQGDVSWLSNIANKASFTLFAKTKPQLRVKHTFLPSIKCKQY